VRSLELDCAWLLSKRIHLRSWQMRRSTGGSRWRPHPSHPADKRLAAQSPMAIGRCRSWLLVSIEFLPSDDRDVADFEALWWSHE
jgi:hypothetical protein